MNTVVIHKNGDLEFIYADGHPGLETGGVTINRASDVEWDNKSQLWQIWFRKPWSYLLGKVRWPEGFKTRKEALDKEVEILESLLRTGGYNEKS